MSSSSPAPKLPIWVFLATDAVLLVAAAYIANSAPHPLPNSATLGVVACVLAGAIIGLVPLVATYERQKNETLDDRQRALEALARTLESSAEQISIAAGGLHEIAEIAQRNLKHAELLPQRLQEKMAEFQAQLTNASDTEKEELEKEVEELRASETERLQTTFDRIARTAGEFAKLEASIQQQLTAANDAVGRLAAGSAAAAKAQESSGHAVTHAREQAAKAVADVAAEAVKEIERAKAAAVRDLSAQFDSNITRLRETAQQLGAVVDRLHAANGTPVTPGPASPAPATPASAVAAALPASAEPPAAAAKAGDVGPAATAPVPDAEAPVAQPVKRGRKPRHEEPSASAAAAGQPAAAAAHSAAESAPGHPAAGAGDPAKAPSPPAVADATAAKELPPSSPRATTIAPAAAPAAAEAAAVNGSAAHEGATASTATAPDPAAALAKSARKRAPRKQDDDQPGLGLDLGDPDTDQAAPAVVERVISSDGATRLIVTAYIGIGNRLFVRGNGPGLSWEKGVPLQFVSIGKWRWETNDASTPVQLKLLKNDLQESVGLGALTIDPGHQHEVTATFD